MKKCNMTLFFIIVCALSSVPVIIPQNQNNNKNTANIPGSGPKWQQDRRTTGDYLSKQDFTLPPLLGGYIIGITKPPYNAPQDRSADVTDIINQAIKDGDANSNFPLLIYFPKGTYVVSDTVKWKNKKDQYTFSISLWGENREKP